MTNTVNRRIAWTALAVLAACGQSSAAPGSSSQPAAVLPESTPPTAATLGSANMLGTAPPAGFAGAAAPASTVAVLKNYHPKELQPGYMRLETTPIEVAAGESDDWAQWVGGPLDQDYDVLDIAGEQSASGHHALLYGAIEAQPAGYTRLWKDEDQTTTRLMGGIGGEGGASSKLPPGVVFRVKKGSYLILQTHYLNTYDYPVLGQAYVDIKMAPVDRSRIVASIFANTNNNLTLQSMAPAAMDIDCTTKADLSFITVSNHMHDYGTSSFTEWIEPSGVKHMIKQDATWSGDFALNPNFGNYPVDAPLKVPAGSTIHTHCEWYNTEAKPVQFPSEMCVFFGFILTDSDVFCVENKWPANAPRNDAGVAPAAAGGSAPGLPSGVPTPSTPAPAASVDCTSGADQALTTATTFDTQVTDCTTPCAFDPDPKSCIQPCLVSVVNLSPSCADCHAETVACSLNSCRSMCLSGSQSPGCLACVDANCGTQSAKCKRTM